jgi:hypothetical protein
MRKVSVKFDDLEISSAWLANRDLIENYTFTVGDKVTVSPPNVQKKRNRGRSGVIVGYYNTGQCPSVKLKFFDNNRYGAVDASDLIPYQDE